MATDEFVDSTLASLKVIGMVTKSGKLCVRKGQLAIDEPKNLQPARRWVHGDSRDITLLHARNTINSAVKICKHFMAAATRRDGDGNSDIDVATWTLERLAHEMDQCETGLQNLRATYAGDSMTVANLDVLADRLRAHKNETTRFLRRRAPSYHQPQPQRHDTPSEAADDEQED